MFCFFLLSKVSVCVCVWGGGGGGVGSPSIDIGVIGVLVKAEQQGLAGGLGHHQDQRPPARILGPKAKGTSMTPVSLMKGRG